MTNADSVFGARLSGTQMMSNFTGRVKSYVALASYAVDLFVGDFVILGGTAGDNEDGESLQTVQQAVAGGNVCGFIVAFKANPDNLNRMYGAASTLRTVYVCDDPYATFEIQTVSGTALTETMIGNNVELIVGSGSTVTGLSGMEADISSTGTATMQLRILQLIPRVDNAYGEHAKILCMTNEHTYKSTTGV